MLFVLLLESGFRVIKVGACWDKVKLDMDGTWEMKV